MLFLILSFFSFFFLLSLSVRSLCFFPFSFVHFFPQILCYKSHRCKSLLSLYKQCTHYQFPLSLFSFSFPSLLLSSSPASDEGRKRRTWREIRYFMWWSWSSDFSSLFLFSSFSLFLLLSLSFYLLLSLFFFSFPSLSICFFLSFSSPLSLKILSPSSRETILMCPSWCAPVC